MERTLMEYKLQSYLMAIVIGFLTGAVGPGLWWGILITLAFILGSKTLAILVVAHLYDIQDTEGKYRK